MIGSILKPKIEWSELAPLAADRSLLLQKISIFTDGWR